MSLQKLYDSLGQAEKDAIGVVKVALDCYNSKDGTGLFTGAARYDVLIDRITIAAVQTRDLFGFWAKLQARMLWGVTTKERDASIVEVLSADNPQTVLTKLATETASIVMIARMLHDIDKAERIAQTGLNSDNDFINDEVPL